MSKIKTRAFCLYGWATKFYTFQPNKAPQMCVSPGGHRDYNPEAALTICLAKGLRKLTCMHMIKTAWFQIYRLNSLCLLSLLTPKYTLIMYIVVDHYKSFVYVYRC